MQTVYIKFLTEIDRANGFFLLAKHSGIASLPGQIYQASVASLAILEMKCIEYRRATDAEVKDAQSLLTFKDKEIAWQSP